MRIENQARHMAFMQAKFPTPPPEPVVVEEPPDILPPVQVDIGLLSQAMDDTFDTTVALENAATTAVLGGDWVRIDNETMQAVDVTDQNNLVVSRGTPSEAHAIGAIVSIQR